MGLWVPGLMVFLFDLAKDANAFTELESDCSGMQRTGTERHQGSFCFYLFSGELNKEVLPYLSLFPCQIDPFPLPWMSITSARNFREVRQLMVWGMVFFPKWHHPMLFLKPCSSICSSCAFLPAISCWLHRFWPCWGEEKCDLQDASILIVAGDFSDVSCLPVVVDGKNDFHITLFMLNFAAVMAVNKPHRVLYQFALTDVSQTLTPLQAAIIRPGSKFLGLAYWYVLLFSEKT